MAINKTNGYSLDHFTARELMYLAMEGVRVWATSTQWRRVEKRARKLGLHIPDPDSYVVLDSIILVDQVIFGCDLMDEVDSFLEDMYIMGMLDQPEEEEDE